MPTVHRVQIEVPIVTRLGTILTGGTWQNGYGVNQNRTLRTYPGGAIVLITRGSGVHLKLDGSQRTVKTGDVILVSPGIPHWYGPSHSDDEDSGWDETYLAFSGPICDLWFRGEPGSESVVNPDNPVLHLGAQADQFAATLQTWMRDLAECAQEKDRIQLIAELQATLGEVLLAGFESGKGQEPWISQARTLLSQNLKSPLDLQKVATELGLGYESFRKRFQQSSGISPHQYRTRQRIEAAKQLLRYSPHLTNAALAESLGFSDEYHFSKQFRRMTGTTPKAYRFDGD